MENLNSTIEHRIPNQANLSQNVDTKKYKQEDLIKLHEFRRHNIREPTRDVLEGKDYFAFTSEDDPKYNFWQIPNFLRSKQLINSIYWTFAVGSMLFSHRYLRTRHISRSIRFSLRFSIVAFFPIWGSLEFRSFLLSIFQEKFLTSLAVREEIRLRSEKNKTWDDKYKEFYAEKYKVETYTPLYGSLSFCNYFYEIENCFLAKNFYAKMPIEKYSLKKNESSDDLKEEVSKEDLVRDSDKTHEYENVYRLDFGFRKDIVTNGEKCVLNFEQLKKHDITLNIPSKLTILKNDALSTFSKEALNTVLLEEIKNAEQILRSKSFFEGDINYCDI